MFSLGFVYVLFFECLVLGKNIYFYKVLDNGNYPRKFGRLYIVLRFHPFALKCSFSKSRARKAGRTGIAWVR